VVSRWLPTAAALVPVQFRSCGICGGQSGTGAGFLRVLPFSLPIIPPTAPHSSSSIIRGWYNRPNSGRRAKWAQYPPILISALEGSAQLHVPAAWVGLRAGLDAMEQRNISCPHRESNSGRPNGGAIPPLHHMSSWRGTYLDNFTFYLCVQKQ
jgi:hypothetical protein